MVDVLSAEHNKSAKAAVMGRIRRALAKNPISDVEIPRDYIRDSEDKPGDPKVIEVFIDALEDYKAKVIRVDQENQIAEAVKTFVGEANEIVVPVGLPKEWLTKIQDCHIQVDIPGENALTNQQLDKVEVVITSSRCAVSHTGTIMLDGTEDQGRRAISLVPDTHICVVKTENVYPTVPQAVDVLKEHPKRASTWIAGPSATSDIELIRVDGVHGPRNLYVIIVG